METKNKIGVVTLQYDIKTDKPKQVLGIRYMHEGTQQRHAISRSNASDIYSCAEQCQVRYFCEEKVEKLFLNRRTQVRNRWRMKDGEGGS